MPDASVLARIDAYIAEHREEITEDFTKILSVESVSDAASDIKPYGAGCRRALELALELARAKGLEAQNCGYYYGLAHTGEGEKTLGIFSHLDVVPAGGGWRYSPYQPTLRDGYIIARGSADNKNAFVIGLHVLACIKSMGLPCRSRLMLYLGCAEETGMADVQRFAAEQPMPDFSIVPDASFPLSHGEKGILQLDAVAPMPFEEIESLTAGECANMVAAQAQASMPYRPMLERELKELALTQPRLSVAHEGDKLLVYAHGISAHASMPEASVNALLLLCGALAGCRTLSPSDSALCAKVAHSLSDNYGEAAGVAFEDLPSGRLTCIGGMAKTVGGVLRVTYDIRYPVTDSGTRVVAALESYFAKDGWTLENIDDSAPCYIPADDTKVVMLSKLYEQLTGNDGTPYTMGGGTYARYLSNAVSFGPNEDEEHPQLPDSLGLPEGHGGIHQPDECFSIEKLLDALRLYTICMLEIDGIING